MHPIYHASLVAVLTWRRVHIIYIRSTAPMKYHLIVSSVTAGGVLDSTGIPYTSISTNSWLSLLRSRVVNVNVSPDSRMDSSVAIHLLRDTYAIVLDLQTPG